MNKFIQFQLWRDCNVGCAFCYNDGIVKGSKVQMLNFARQRLLQDDIGTDYTSVGFIGGEFFDNQLDDVQPQFVELMCLVIDLIKNQKIKQVYITTSLIYKDLSVLFDVVNMYERAGCLDRLLLCTSYDTIYRFKNKNSERLWYSNMASIRQQKPELRTHVEIILTRHFIDQVLNNKFNIVDFEQRLNTTVDFIQCQYFKSNATKYDVDKILPDFIPSRKSFHRFVRKISSEKQYDVFKLLNPYFHSSVIYVEHNGEILSIDDRLGVDVKSDLYYKELQRESFKLDYIDSDRKMIDDVQLLVKDLSN